MQVGERQEAGNVDTPIALVPGSALKLALGGLQLALHRACAAACIPCLLSTAMHSESVAHPAVPTTESKQPTQAPLTLLRALLYDSVAKC